MLAFIYEPLASMFCRIKLLRDTLTPQQMQAFMNADLATLKQRVSAIDKNYDAVTVAWNDGSRGVENGMLSCWGDNITDARLVAKDGGVLPFVRPNNMDEILGVTTADKIMLVERDGTQITAHEVLQTLEERAKCMGYTSVKTNVKDPEHVVVRVQNIWVPLRADEAERKFVPAHYSYQTRDASNPRNLIVLGTPSGTYVHSDAQGINRLYAHTEDDEGINNHWFVAEESKLCVGQSGDEVGSSFEQAACKKGRFVEMGLKGMGRRANCFVVMSIPNTQQEDPEAADDNTPIYRSLCFDDCARNDDADGISMAAIVSADTSNVESKASKNCIDIVRPENEPIVITIMVYNTVRAQQSHNKNKELTISSDDLRSAIHDIKKIYELCDATCKLSELRAMLSKLTTEMKNKIACKLAYDPPLITAGVPMCVDE